MKRFALAALAGLFSLSALADVSVAFPWRMTIAAVCAFCVCLLGKRPDSIEQKPVPNAR